MPDVSSALHRTGYDARGTPVSKWDPSRARAVDVMLAVEGDLVLASPAALGVGAVDAATDLPLDLDPVSGRPRLRGSRVAGPLRHALLERELGAPGTASMPGTRAATYAALLCGGDRGDAEGLPSPLVPQTSLAAPLRDDQPAVEWRTQTAVEDDTGAYRDGSLRTRELCPAGTRFPLRWTVEVGPDVRPHGVSTAPGSGLAIDLAAGPTERADGTRVSAEERAVRRALAAALEEIESGVVRVGARTTRGYGRLSVEGLRVLRFDLSTPDGLAAWVAYCASRSAAAALETAARKKGGTGLQAIPREDLLVEAPLPDARGYVRIEAAFDVRGSLLIAESDVPDLAADRRHVEAAHGTDGRVRRVVPGTSWAGALRARLLRLYGESAVRDLMGWADDEVEGPGTRDRHHPERARRSRLSVEETAVEGGAGGWVVTRAALDRFTQGTVQAKLFSEMPVLSDRAAPAQVRLVATVWRPRPEDPGRLLALLRDLWEGDLGLGSGFARGRLEGNWATLDVCPAGRPGTDAVSSKGGLEGAPRRYVVRADGGRSLGLETASAPLLPSPASSAPPAPGTPATASDRERLNAYAACAWAAAHPESSDDAAP